MPSKEAPKKPETLVDVVEEAKEIGRARRERIMTKIDLLFAPDKLLRGGKDLLEMAAQRKKEEAREKIEGLIEKTRERAGETRERWGTRIKGCFERLKNRGGEIKNRTEERLRDLGERAAVSGISGAIRVEEAIGKRVLGQIASFEEWRLGEAQKSVESLQRALAEAEERAARAAEQAERARKRAEQFGYIRRLIEGASPSL